MISLRGQYKSKKECKEKATGRHIYAIFENTSMFSDERDRTGDQPFVGPSAYNRKFYGTVTTDKDGMILKIK